jgi:hypothetical protein
MVTITWHMLDATTLARHHGVTAMAIMIFHHQKPYQHGPGFPATAPAASGLPANLKGEASNGLLGIHRVSHRRRVTVH